MSNVQYSMFRPIQALRQFERGMAWYWHKAWSCLESWHRALPRPTCRDWANWTLNSCVFNSKSWIHLLHSLRKRKIKIWGRNDWVIWFSWSPPHTVLVVREMEIVCACFKPSRDSCDSHINLFRQHIRGSQKGQEMKCKRWVGVDFRVAHTCLQKPQKS